MACEIPLISHLFSLYPQDISHSPSKFCSVHRQGSGVKQCQISKGKQRVQPQAAVTPGTTSAGGQPAGVELGRKNPGSQETLRQHGHMAQGRQTQTQVTKKPSELHWEGRC